MCGSKLSTIGVGEVHPQYKHQCTHIEVLNDAMLSLNSYELGAVKTWVHVPHTDWSNILVKEAEWIMLMQVMKDILNDLVCTVILQIIEARPGKNKRSSGE